MKRKKELLKIFKKDCSLMKNQNKSQLIQEFSMKELHKNQ